MTQAEIKKILENHQHWLMKNVDGWEQMRADLRRADLSGANLRGADLRRADLSGADLTGADLRWAKLSEADLNGADLNGADLRGADLRGANLSEADLRGADLRWANLSEADLNGAELGWADLNGADLRGADLRGANLYGANLTRANITGADLTGAKNLNIPMACPSNGNFIGWKKAIHPEDEKQLLVKLLIPDDARRSSATTSKCRCDKAQVLEIMDLDGNAFGVALSNHNNEFVYRVGETVKVDDFCTDRFQECAAGIHFFVDREAAIRYER